MTVSVLSTVEVEEGPLHKMPPAPSIAHFMSTTNVSHAGQKPLSYRERWGFPAAASAAFYDRCRRWLGLRVYGIHTRAIEMPEGPDPVAEGFSFRLFKTGDADALLDYAKSPELDLSREFVEGALKKGDVCDAIIHDGSIVSYGWTAFSPTHDEDGVFVGFGNRYGYAYKGFTLPEFRGRHLLRISRPYRDRNFLASGRCTHLILFIALSNRASVRLTRGIGYRRVGIAGFFKRGAFFWAFRSPGAKEHGFRFLLPPRAEPSGTPTGAA